MAAAAFWTAALFTTGAVAASTEPACLEVCASPEAIVIITTKVYARTFFIMSLPVSSCPMLVGLLSF